MNVQNQLLAITNGKKVPDLIKKRDRV